MSDFIKRVVVEEAGSSSESTFAEHVELINADGTPFSGGGSYSLPSSDVNTLGGVKVSAENLGGMNAVDTYINDSVIKGRVPNASASTPGLVKQAAHVASASGENVTAAEFEALLDALEAAGIVAGA